MTDALHARALVMARECAADRPGLNALQKQAFLDGQWDDAPAVQSALAATLATTGLAAFMISTRYKYGKRGADALRSGAHLKEPTS